jgi:UDP-glucose 4-epimerase
MKILITGGTGFIGSHLATLLEAKRHDVTLLSYEGGVFVGSTKFILADITDREKILDIIPKFDVVYHLAGLLGTNELIKEAYRASRVNIIGTINILDGALKNKTKVIHITKPNVWLNTYSITKEAGEKFTKMYYEQMGLPSVKWLNVYGPRQSFHCQKAVPFFIRWALKNESIEIWGSGEQTMDLIHAKDAARATIMIGENKNLEGQTVDVGTGVETTVNWLADKIITMTNSRSKVRHLSMRAGETSATRLAADTFILNKFGFKTEYTLEGGLRETVEWYKKHLQN